jgi:hypothetical protein
MVFDNSSQLLRLKIISLMIYPVCRGTQVSSIGHHILFSQYNDHSIWASVGEVNNGRSAL